MAEVLHTFSESHFRAEHELFLMKLQATKKIHNTTKVLRYYDDITHANN